MANLMAEWLILAGAEIQTVQQLVENHLHDMILKTFDPKKADAGAAGESKGGNFAAIHASGFRDFLLKAELLRAIVDCGFEHPSEVQHECIPQAILGTCARRMTDCLGPTTDEK